MSSIEHTNDTAAPPAAEVPFAPDLSVLDEREFTTQIALINGTYAAAQRAHEEARDALGAMLTEQISRRIRTLLPGAYMLQAREAAEFHYDPVNGQIAEDCDGHNSRLVPAEVMTEDGTVLGTLDHLDPVCFWLERLTPILESNSAVLLLPDRTWAVGVAVDSPDDTADEEV